MCDTMHRCHVGAHNSRHIHKFGLIYRQLSVDEIHTITASDAQQRASNLANIWHDDVHERSVAMTCDVMRTLACQTTWADMTIRTGDGTYIREIPAHQLILRMASTAWKEEIDAMRC